MSELNDSFFSRLAQKLPGMIQSKREAMMKLRAKRNGGCQTQPPCTICGKFFGSAKVCGKPTEPYCPSCDEALAKGCAAFVTLEKPQRYWIGRGAHPILSGKVTVITADEMDAIVRLDAAAN